MKLVRVKLPSSHSHSPSAPRTSVSFLLSPSPFSFLPSPFSLLPSPSTPPLFSHSPSSYAHIISLALPLLLPEGVFVHVHRAGLLARARLFEEQHGTHEGEQHHDTTDADAGDDAVVVDLLLEASVVVLVRLDLC